MTFLQVAVADLAIEIGKVGLWIQAVGLLIVIIIVYYFVTMYYNRKRRLYLKDIDARSQDSGIIGMTALHIACHRNNALEEFITLLLDNGAAVNLTDKVLCFFSLSDRIVDRTDGRR